MTIAIPLKQMQVAFHYNAPDAAGELVNTMGFDANAFAGSPQDALDAVHGAWQTRVVTLLAGSTVYIGATALYESSGGLMSLAHPSTTNGSGPSGQTTSCASMLVQKRTAFAGKKNRGRIYLGGLPGADIDGSNPNLWSSSAVGQFQTGFNGFYTDMITASLLPVIFHQQPATSSVAITNFTVVQRLVTQRGRLRD